MTTRKDDEDTLAMLHLHHNEGKSYTEIASLFGLARSAVAKRIQRVRQQDCLHDPAEAAAYWDNQPKGTST